jgi:predicted AAA+ superfamily ATPase
MVFLKLKQDNKEIYYHKDEHECDFVIKDNSKITKAIQVCYDLNDGNLDRESKGLLEAMNKFKLKEGTIITFNQEKIIKEHNIHVVPVWKWLLEEEL